MQTMQDATPIQANTAFLLLVPEPRGVLLEMVNVDFFYLNATMPKYFVLGLDDVLLAPYSWLSYGARLAETVLPPEKPYQVSLHMQALEI